MSRLLVAACLTLLASCASPGRGAGSRPAARGEALYRAHCGACHQLRAPSELTRDAWARAVERYGPRAHLDAGERREVLDHLQSGARPAGPGEAVRP